MNPLLGFAAIVLAGAVAVVAAVLAVASPAAACRAGVSSVGPAVIRDGHLVEVAKPYTESCLP